VVIVLLDTEFKPAPCELVAKTVNVYSFPGFNPVTVIGDVVPVAVIPPGVDIAVYPVIGYPPSDAGAVYATVAVDDPVFVASPIVGAPGVLGFI